jgi:hypothetical protein
MLRRYASPRRELLELKRRNKTDQPAIGFLAGQCRSALLEEGSIDSHNGGRPWTLPQKLSRSPLD